MDDPANYPVLLHCRAGLHRTGVLTAVYRMEYNHWSAGRAWQEMRDFGFGEMNCYADNVYIDQYICRYTPGLRQNATAQSQNGNVQGQPGITHVHGSLSP
jgi:hypothetical protein